MRKKNGFHIPLRLIFFISNFLNNYSKSTASQTQLELTWFRECCCCWTLFLLLFRMKKNEENASRDSTSWSLRAAYQVFLHSVEFLNSLGQSQRDSSVSSFKVWWFRFKTKICMPRNWEVVYSNFGAFRLTADSKCSIPKDFSAFLRRV